MYLNTILTGFQLIALAVLTSTAVAPQERQRIGVRLSPMAPKEMEKYIIDKGAFAKSKTLSSETLSQLAIRKCGHKTRYFLEKAASRNSVTMNHVFSSEEIVELPSCPFWERNVPHELAAPTTVRDLLVASIGKPSPMAVADFRAQNLQLGDVTLESVLNPGLVFLPYRTAWRAIDLRPELGLNSTTAIAELRKLMGTRGSNGEAAKSEKGLFMRAGGGRTAVEDSSQCTPSSQSATWPFDPVAVRSALARSVALARTANRYNDRVVIGVLDSNFPGEFTGLLADRVVRIGPNSSPTSLGVDGGNVEKGPLSFSQIADRDHGSMILSLVLGGPAFLDADAKTRASMLRVRANTVQTLRGLTLPSGLPETEVTQEAVYNALDDAVKAGATVANMSFSFPKKLGALEDQLKRSEKVLVVAAAGNDGSDFNDEQVMPAALGGFGSEYSYRVVTVGATEDGGLRAEFSNYDDMRVDLFAPGCSVPALDFYGQLVAASGTSLSAPLVSFVAGLLQQLGMSTPAYVKHRLIASADVNRNLLSSSWSGGTLNPVKALSVFEDFVELDGATSPLLGNVAWPPATTWDCVDGTTSVDPKDVLKAARIDNAGPNASWLVVWRQGDTIRKCYARLSGERIRLPGRQAYEPMAFVRDFVAKQPENRF